MENNNKENGKKSKLKIVKYVKNTKLLKLAKEKKNDYRFKRSLSLYELDNYFKDILYKKETYTKEFENFKKQTEGKKKTNLEYIYLKYLKLRETLLKDVEKYYKDVREYRFDNNTFNDKIELRKKIKFIFRILLKINRLLKMQNLKIIGDENTEKSDKPKIYAVTHIGRYDIEMAEEIIKDGSFFMLGDPNETYKNFDGLLLYLLGFMPFDIHDKTDRHIVKERSKLILKVGGNIFMFPEGAWNITPNETVMELFAGIIEMARECGAEIVPIAIQQFGKKYYAKIGKSYTIDKENTTIEENKAELREILINLKWDIYDYRYSHGKYRYKKEKYDKRGNDPADIYARKNVDETMKDTENGYTEDEINNTKYHNKEKEANSYEAVFKVIDELENKNKENAFLYSKKNNGVRR